MASMMVLTQISGSSCMVRRLAEVAEHLAVWGLIGHIGRVHKIGSSPSARPVTPRRRGGSADVMAGVRMLRPVIDVAAAHRSS